MRAASDMADPNSLNAAVSPPRHSPSSDSPADMVTVVRLREELETMREKLLSDVKAELQTISRPFTGGRRSVDGTPMRFESDFSSFGEDRPITPMDEKVEVAVKKRHVRSAAAMSELLNTSAESGYARQASPFERQRSPKESDSPRGKGPTLNIPGSDDHARHKHDAETGGARRLRSHAAMAELESYPTSGARQVSPRAIEVGKTFSKEDARWEKTSKVHPGDDDGEPPSPCSPCSFNASARKKAREKEEAGSDNVLQNSKTTGQLDTVMGTKDDDVNGLDYSMGLVGSAQFLPQTAGHFQRKADALIRLPAFEGTTLTLISLSAVLIGLDANFTATGELDTNKSMKLAFRVLDLMFCAAFAGELLLRLFAYRTRFFKMPGWAWNWFDFTVVMLQFVEEFFMVVLDNDSAMQNSVILRVARVLRAVRVMRVFRMVRFARDLRLLVMCIISSGRAFFWVTVLLFLMTFVISVYIVQVIQQARPSLPAEEYADLEFWFGTVPRAMLSLFEALTGGVDWDELCRPLMVSIGPFVGYFFTAYMAFSVLAVLNIVTGTFVEAAIERAAEVKLVDRVYQARRLFQTLDLDKSGLITFNEVVEHMNQIDKTELKEYFESIDVDISEASCLFEILDVDDSGSIDLEEFISGCLRMQGPAKALDLLLITRESSRSQSRQEKSLTSLQTQMRRVNRTVEHICRRLPAGNEGRHAIKDLHAAADGKKDEKEPAVLKTAVGG
eukprot:TRINITY_DN31105_c0_g1_i1.p1 TRINITY_DN31105_c0_g1~~TRINITY_DN31105_c0_g1_i1.p1  ORF type:complete len:730 (+),score=136.86 TRINITY_DN31105_c0_g1_i1:69-2258(+)